MSYTYGQRLLLEAHAREHVAKYRPCDPPRGNGDDFGRISLLPLPDSVVGPALEPFAMHYAYIAGEDEPIAHCEQTDLDRLAYQQWLDHEMVYDPRDPTRWDEDVSCFDFRA